MIEPLGSAHADLVSVKKVRNQVVRRDVVPRSNPLDPG
jgi:hypothetical protein